MGDGIGERLQIPVGSLKVIRPPAKLRRGLELHGNVAGDRRRADQFASLVTDGRDRQ